MAVPLLLDVLVELPGLLLFVCYTCLLGLLHLLLALDCDVTFCLLLVLGNLLAGISSHLISLLLQLLCLSHLLDFILLLELVALSLCFLLQLDVESVCELKMSGLDLAF